MCSCHNAVNCGDPIIAQSYVISFITSIHNDSITYDESIIEVPSYGFQHYLALSTPPYLVIENLDIVKPKLALILPLDKPHAVTIVHSSLHKDIVTMHSHNVILDPLYSATELSPLDHHKLYLEEGLAC